MKNIRIGVLPFLLFIILTCANSLAFASDPRATKPHIPIESFARLSDYLDISISPDGKHYAARIRNNESVYALIVRVADGETVGGIAPGDKNEIHSIVWGSNERVVYSLAEKRAFVDAPSSTGELFAVNIDNSQNRLIAGYRAGDKKTGTRIKSKTSDWSTHQVIAALPDDRKHVLIAEFPWSKEGHYFYDSRKKNPIISKLNIYTGKKTKQEIIPFSNSHIYAAEDGTIRFVTWGDENAELHAAYRDSDDAEWQEISQAFKLDSENLVVYAIDKSGQRVYLEGIIGDDDYATLYEYNLESQTMTRLFDSNQSDIENWMTDQSGAVVIGVSYPDKVQYHYAKSIAQSPMVKYHKMLRKAFKGQHVSIKDFNDKADHLLVRVSSSTNPGEYYAFNTKTNQAGFIWANYSWIDPAQMAGKQAISFEATDGRLIHGLLTVPNTGEQASPSPLIVLPHGGPHGVRDYPSFDPEVQLLASRGYAVLQINFRGSGGYGREFERAGYREWGGRMIQDLIDGTRWAASQQQIDAERICVYGASYGGYAALMSAIRAPDLYKCTVGYVGVYDLSAMMSKGDIPKSFGGLGYLRKVLGTDEQQLAANSPVNLAHKIKAPVMLIHGDEDIRVPNYHAKAMRKALRKQGIEPQWLYLDDVAHGARSLKNRTLLYRELLEFLHNNLPPQ